MSVRMSVCQPRLGGNVIFSAPNWDIASIFFVQIPLINEHLFCKYFVRLSVGNATKLCYFWMFSFFFCNYKLLCCCDVKTSKLIVFSIFLPFPKKYLVLSIYVHIFVCVVFAFEIFNIQITLLHYCTFTFTKPCIFYTTLYLSHIKLSQLKQR